MTTTVKISAHMSTDKIVEVSVKENGTEIEAFTLEDGEEMDVHAYDEREISVKEVLKNP